MQQIITTVKTEIVTQTNSYQETQNLQVLTGKTIITNPRMLTTGKIVLDTTPQFQLLRAFSSTFIQIYSDFPFYLKLIVDSDLSALTEEGMLLAFTLKTSSFSYNSVDQPLIVAVGNGSMDVSPVDGALVATPSSKEQMIEFILSSHDLNFSNVDFSAWSQVWGGNF